MNRVVAHVVGDTTPSDDAGASGGIAALEAAHAVAVSADGAESVDDID